MSRDTNRTHLHLHTASHADLLEEFTRTPLLPDEIFLQPEFQPTNPEDEDDVVPDQHAAFGIRAATGEKKEGAWKDLRLEELLKGASETQAGVHIAPNAGEILRRRKIGKDIGGGSLGGRLRT